MDFPNINLLDSVRDLGAFLTKSSAFPCTSTNSLAPAATSLASCVWYLALCPMTLQSPSPIPLLPVGLTIAFRFWWSCPYSSNCPSRQDSSLCSPSYWAQTKICFCYIIHPWHAAQASSCAAYLLHDS